MTKMKSNKFQQYLILMRVDKPIGTLLLLWPTLWALWVAFGGVPPATIFWVFVLGVFVMRSAGCVINDLADRKIDPLVERTQERPLASGVLKSIDALKLFVVLCLVALGLLLCLPKSVWPWSVPALIVTIIYPFMKRYIQAPQAVLGVAFSFSVPMAFVAADAAFDQRLVLIMLINFCWVIAYDTAYAMSDREDDLKIGVKSTAILFGDYDRLIIGALQGLVVFGLIALKFLLDLSNWYFVSVSIVLGLFAYQQYLIAARSRADCFAAFLNNGWVGAIVFLGLLGG